MDPLAQTTPAEAALERLLNELGGGVLAGEFKREWPVGPWRVDFYFPTVRLAIEVDGGYHRAQSRWRKDQRKTSELEAQGITVLRITNAQVFGDRERLVVALREAWRCAQRRALPISTSAREPEAPYLHAVLQFKSRSLFP